VSYDTLCAGPGAEAAEDTDSPFALATLLAWPNPFATDAAHWGISQQNQFLEKPMASVRRGAGQANIPAMPSNQSLWYKKC